MAEIQTDVCLGSHVPFHGSPTSGLKVIFETNRPDPIQTPRNICLASNNGR